MTLSSLFWTNEEQLVAKLGNTVKYAGTNTLLKAGKSKRILMSTAKACFEALSFYSVHKSWLNGLRYVHWILMCET